MKRIALHLLAGAVAAGLAGSANAADFGAPMPGPGPVVVPYEAPGGGWYLRGDVGVGATTFGAWDESSLAAPANGAAGWSSRSMSGSAFLRGGVGYQFNSYLRGDVTVEYRTTGSLHGVNYIYNGGTNQTFADNVSGHWSSVAAMANGYVDMGEFWGLSPFIGAGVGVAHNRLTGVQDTAVGITNLGGFGSYADGGKTNFAWALHAGVGYQVNRNLKLELGYRYMNLGDAKTGALTCYNGAGGFSAQAGCGSTLTVKKLVTNDVHVGMRWLLNPPEPVAQPIPVYAKN